MKSLIFIALCCYLVSSYVESATNFKFEDCSKGKGIATVTQFSLLPDPISLSQNISASVQIQLHQDIPPNSFVKNRVYKVSNLFGLPFDIPAPCIRGVGSCTTEVCKYFKSFKDQVCPFVPSDLECACPLKSGLYRGENVTIPMPEMGSFTKILASGDFRVEWRMIQKVDFKEKELVCFKFYGKTEA